MANGAIARQPGRVVQFVRRSGSSPAVGRLKDQLQKARHAAVAARARAVGKGHYIPKVGSVLAGGAAGGALGGLIGEEVMGIDTRLVGGAALIATSVFVLKGQIAEYVALAGAGMAAAGLGDVVGNLIGDKDEG